MGIFKNDHSSVKENAGFQPLPEGEYEVFPIAYDIDKARTGSMMVIFNYKVRDDVEGQEEYGGKEIRFDNFVQKENSIWRFQAASKAAQLEDGKEYNELKEWAEDFKGKPVRLYVKQVENNKGKLVNEVAGFKVSEASGQAPTSDMDNGAPIEVDDDDLPF